MRKSATKHLELIEVLRSARLGSAGKISGHAAAHIRDNNNDDQLDFKQYMAIDRGYPNRREPKASRFEKIWIYSR